MATAINVAASIQRQDGWYPLEQEQTMLNHGKKLAGIIALGTITALAGQANAQQNVSASGPELSATTQSDTTARPGPKATWLNLGQIYDKVVAAGYTDIRDIEREEGGYEVKGLDSQGRLVKLHVEPFEGQIVNERTRDQKSRRNHN